MRTSIFLAKLTGAPLTALGNRWAAHEFLASAALNTPGCFLASLGQLGLGGYLTLRGIRLEERRAAEGPHEVTT